MVSKEQREAFYLGQKGYADGYEKTIKPQYEAAHRFISASMEYGKLTISSLILVSGGGLAGMLTIQPLVRDLNQTWLIQGTWVAVAFCTGLFFAIVSAAVSYLNFALLARSAVARAFAEEALMKAWHFSQLDFPEAERIAAGNAQVHEQAQRRSWWAYIIAVSSAVVSAFACAAGGIMLARSLLTLTLI